MEYYLRKFYQGYSTYKEMILVVAAVPVLIVSVIGYMLSPWLAIGVFGFYLVFIVFSYTLSLREAVFLMILISTENIFYLFDRSKLIFIYDMRQLVGLMMMSMFVLYLPKIIASDFLFKGGVLAFFGYCCFSILVAQFTVGQTLMNGAYTIMLPSLILAYFYLCFLMEDVIRFERFKELYIVTSGIAGTIYILQYLLYPQIVFLTTDFRPRLGNIRFTEFIIFMNLALFMTLNILLTEKAGIKTFKRHIYKVIFVIQCIAFFMVCQSRLQSITTVLLIVFALVFLQNRFPKPMVIVVMMTGFIGLIGVLVLLNILGVSIAGNIFTDSVQEVRELSGNLGIRMNGAKFFLDNLKGHWLFGWGSLNIGNHEAFIASGLKFGYYLGDVGLLGYVYLYGIVGALISLLLLMRAISVSIHIYISDNNVFYPLLGTLSILMNGMMIYYFHELSALFYIGLLLAFIEFEAKRGVTNE